MKALPTQYHLEVYENSFINDSVWSIESTTPILGISIGDRFNYRSLSHLAWYDAPNEKQVLRVKDIEHIFWEIENSHVGHKLMVCLEIVPK